MVLCTHVGTGGTGGASCSVADFVRGRGGATGVTGDVGSEDAPEDVGRLSLDRTDPNVRLRCFLTSGSTTGEVSTGMVIEDSARGDRCLEPPPGVEGALATSEALAEAAMEGPARGEDRSGRDKCEGDNEPTVAECRRVAMEGRAGIVNWWSAEGRRGGERVTVEGAEGIEGPGVGWKKW